MGTATRLWLCALLLLASPVRAQEPYWTSTGGPIRTEVYELTAGPDGSAYALSSSALFRTGDGGANWTRASLPATASSPALIGLAVAQERTLLAATPIFCAVDCYQEGRYRSTDDGQTWVRFDVGSPDHLVRAFVAGPSGVFAIPGGAGPLYRSEDGGGTWAPIHAIPAGEYTIAGAAGPEGGAAAVTTEAVYRSADGVAWTRTATTGSLAFSHNSELAHDGTLYGWDGANLRRLPPGASAWEAVPAPAELAYIYACRPEADGTLHLGSDAGVHVSADGGLTWVPDGLGVVTYDFVRVGGELLAGTAETVWRRTGPGTWAPSSTGLVATWVTALAALPGEQILAGTYHQGVHLYAGGAWSHEFPLNGTVVGVAAAPDGALYVAAIGALHRSDDGGATWSENLRTGALNALAVAADGSVYVGYFGAPSVQLGVFRSPDRGATWTNVGFAGQLVQNLAAGEDGAVYAVAGTQLHRSDDGGTTWVPLAAPRYLPTPAGSLLFATDGAAILRSPDRGVTWESPFDAGAPVWSLAAVGPAVVAVTETRAYVSTDEGTTWAALGEPLPAARAVALGTDGFAYVGTDGHGVLRSRDLVWTAAGENAPAARVVIRAVPNPVRSRVAFRYRLPRGGAARLALYDVLGREVAVLAAGLHAPGDHEVEADASHLAPGVYRYRLDAGPDGRATGALVVKR